jgi:hypothetical protein
MFILGPKSDNARAEELLSNAYLLPEVEESEYVVHTASLLYQRVDPNRIEPPDPYHLPIVSLYSDTTKTESWAYVKNGEVFQERIIYTDYTSGITLSDFINNGKQALTYNDTGYKSVYSSQSGVETTDIERSSVTLQNQKGVDITEVTSIWEKPAWKIVSHDPKPVEEDTSQLNTYDPLYRQKPYLQDLKINDYIVIWVVDKESERLVSFEWIANTSDGEVLLQKIENLPFEIQKLPDLPDNWLSAYWETSPIEGQYQPPNSSRNDLESVSNEIDFIAFQPQINSDLIADMSLKYINYLSEPISDWKVNWVFDIQNSAAYGLALQTMYVPDQFTPDDSRVFVLIQGPSKDLVPLMKETKPNWTESYSVDIQIGKEKLTGWIAKGGVYQTDPAQVVLMLEAQGTFVFIVGQSYSEAQIVQFAQTLTPKK